MPVTCPYCNGNHSDETLVCPVTGKELSQSLRFVGKKIGKYEIIRLIGEGGMGAVFEARHTEIRRRVAIKLLNPALAHDLEALARFTREARATGEIGHENIIEIYDIGKDPETGATYLVLELLKGRTLQNMIDERCGLPINEVVDIMLQVLSALHASHLLGIVHRDLKPDNIFLTTIAGRKNWVKVLDFGIAKIKESGEGHKLTRTGQIIGTPYYMAPEQIKGGGNVDHRSDIYSCGVILYQCLTGKLPFTAPTLQGLIYSILSDEPEDPRVHRPGIPDELVSIVLKAMSKDPAMRYQSAAEMATALEKFGSGMMEVQTELSKVDELAKTMRAKIEGEKTIDKTTSKEQKEQALTELDWKTSKSWKKIKNLTLGIVIVVIILLVGSGLGIFFFKGKLSGKKEVVETSKNTFTMQSMQPKNLEPQKNLINEKERVKVEIEVFPVEAKIFLDGAIINQNPFKSEFDKSDTPHLLEAKLDGFKPWKEWIKFDTQIDRKINLEPSQTEETQVEAEKEVKKKKRKSQTSSSTGTETGKAKGGDIDKYNPY